MLKHLLRQHIFGLAPMTIALRDFHQHLDQQTTAKLSHPFAKCIGALPQLFRVVLDAKFGGISEKLRPVGQRLPERLEQRRVDRIRVRARRIHPPKVTSAPLQPRDGSQSPKPWGCVECQRHAVSTMGSSSM